MFKKVKVARNRNLALYSIVDHFSKYKWMYILLGLVCVVGIIIGFVFGFGKKANFSIADLPDAVLVDFINKKISGASVFFARIFAFLGIIVLIWCVNLKPFLCWFSFFIVLYRAFLIGVNCSILMILYKFGGIVNVFVVFLPVHLFAMVGLLMWCAVCFYACATSRKTGMGVVNGLFFKNNKGILCLVLILAFIAYLLEAILMPYVTSAIFIGVS